MLQIAKVLKSNGTQGAILIGLRDVALDEIRLQEPVFIYFDGLPVPFFITSAEQRGTSKAIVSLSDVCSLKDAEELVGRAVFIEGEWEESEAEEDLTGWTLLCRGTELGEITGMELIPGNPCLYLGETLIPLNEDLILGCDPSSRTLDMDIPEGLL